MVRLSDEEREAIRAAAEADQRSMSDWARVTLINAARQSYARSGETVQKPKKIDK
ncbi:hypothetical protein LG047_15685 [Methylocystis sp. WRRC1]|uniref:hypothetical protein n=1 Tax=Methylocystis sp. WRRC1 TaxID=1732014 RepID=UPI001D1493A5|nr:hypothetical protein [Methylocystis sp. WRRC1]MCC3246742.1 hypothetical protein [Methylocystis sp. WRRC1]